MAPSTSQRIIEAAFDVLARNPLATLEQVAEAAGIGRATLFRYFSSKKALMRELALEANRRCMAVLIPLNRAEGPPAERLAQAVEAFIPLGAAFHFLTYEPWHSGDEVLEEDYKRYLAQWALLLEQVREAGLIDRELPLAWVVNALDALLFGAWESISQGEIAPRQAAALTLRTFLRGVSKPEN